MFGPLERLCRRLTAGRRQKARAHRAGPERRSPDLRVDPGMRFIRTIQRMKQANPTFRDHLYIISLKDFRVAVGEKWGRLADIVSDLGKNVVDRHLGKDGLFCQADDQTFVLTLPKDNRDKARRRVVEIAQDLSAYLVGDQLIKGQRPMILAANIPFEKAVNGLGRFDLGALAEAVEESRSVAFVAVPAGQGAPAEEQAVPAFASLEVFRVGEAAPSPRLTLVASNPQPEAGDAHAQAQNPGEPGWSPARHARNSGQIAEWQRIRARAAQGNTRFPWDDPGPLAEGTRLSVVWRPTWLARSEAVAAYAARVLRFEEAGKPPTEGSHAYPQKQPMDGLNIDRVVIAQTLRQLQAASARGRQTSVIVPLCWMSVTTDHRRALLGPLADLPKAILRDRLMVEVTHLPDVPDCAQLTDMLAFLANMGIAAMVRVRMVNALRLINAQVQNSLAVDLSELAPDERIGDAALLERLSELRDMAGRNGAGFAIWGIRRRNVIAASVNAGFAMVSGPGLMSDANAVRPAIPLARAALVESLNSSVRATTAGRMSAAHA
jgi:hypothetical protein